jgi:hypothetical protein
MLSSECYGGGVQCNYVASAALLECEGSVSMVLSQCYLLVGRGCAGIARHRIRHLCVCV